MQIKQNNNQSWGLTINEFNNSSFGNEIGNFKATNDLLKKYLVINQDATINQDNLDRLFADLTTTIIYRFVGKADYLNHIDFTGMPNDYQREMRYAVYKELSNGISGAIFEKRTKNDVSTSGFSQESDLSGWTIPADAISTDTWERLEKVIGIYDYELIDGILYYKGEAYNPSFKTGQKLSTIAIVGATRDLYDKAEVDKLIAKTLSASKDFKGQATTADLNNLVINYDSFLKTQFPTAADGDSAEIKYVDINDAFNGLIESYTLINGVWTLATSNYETKSQIALLAQLLTNLETVAARTDAVILKDGSNDMDASYTPANPKSVVVLDWAQTALATLKASLSGNNQTKTITDLEVLIADLAGRISAVEANPSASYISAFKEWTGDDAGTAITNGKSWEIATKTANDGQPFVVAAGKEFTGYFLGSVNGENKRIPFKAIVAAPDATITELTSSREWDVVIDATGKISFTVTGAGQAQLDVSSLRLFAIHEYILQSASGVALKSDFTTFTSQVQTSLNQKQDKILAIAIEGATAIEQILTNLSNNKVNTSLNNLTGTKTLTDKLYIQGSKGGYLKFHDTNNVGSIQLEGKQSLTGGAGSGVFVNTDGKTNITGLETSNIGYKDVANQNDAGTYTQLKSVVDVAIKLIEAVNTMNGNRGKVLQVNSNGTAFDYVDLPQGGGAGGDDGLGAGEKNDANSYVGFVYSPETRRLIPYHFNKKYPAANPVIVSANLRLEINSAEKVIRILEANTSSDDIRRDANGKPEKYLATTFVDAKIPFTSSLPKEINIDDDYVILRMKGEK